MSGMPPGYPFCALVGQDAMKLALVLNAVNPRIGGVLVRGEKGTAKSTAARGLAALLPPIEVVEGCRFGCDPQPGAPRCPDCERREPPLRAAHRAAVFVDLPVGATEDRVLGSLELERAVQLGERHFEPGLLARANRGLLYVDEVNLLPDHLVDALLDAAAMGVNTVEREGVSFTHPAAFVLVGTMNPEEGELRPQLLDRFALAVDVAGMSDPAERAEVVRRRIAYESDPRAFSERWAADENEARARIAAARQRLPDVVLDDALLELIARICIEFGVDGLRADLVMYRTASTLAAYEGRTRVSVDDVRRAAELTLPHRRRRQPFDEHGLDRQQLDEIVRDHGPADIRPPEPPRAPSDSDEVFDIEAVTTPPALAIGAPRVRARAPAGGRRGQHVEGPRGRHVRGVPLDRSSSRALDVAATVLAAAPYQGLRPGSEHGLQIERRDIRVKLRTLRSRVRTLFVVDASGSMAARRRMAAAKGAVLSLLLQAYQQRDEVGLIAFRGGSAALVLAPTTSTELASARLREMPTGGRTPLAAALRLAHLTFRRGAGGATKLVLVSDGRANVSLDGGHAMAESLAEAHAIAATGVTSLVVDSEDGPVRLGLAQRLSSALRGHYLRLADLRADRLAEAVRLLRPMSA